eukprot:952745-Pyramimonas_sp.AAC.1
MKPTRVSRMKRDCARLKGSLGLVGPVVHHGHPGADGEYNLQGAASSRKGVLWVLLGEGSRCPD